MRETDELRMNRNQNLLNEFYFFDENFFNWLVSILDKKIF